MKERNAAQSKKDRAENACVKCFLDWYTHISGTAYSVKRTEHVFPELADITRWDFIATPRGEREWCALEVKGLIRPQAKVGLVHWTKMFAAVTKQLLGLLQGEYLVVGTPSLWLNRNENRKLREILPRVVLTKAKNMNKGASVKLGADILTKFPNWPSRPNVEMRPQPHLVKIPDEIELFKISDRGLSIEPGMSPVDIFDVSGAVEESTNALFDPAKEGILKANEQLGLARVKGANMTILLLDCHLPWDPDSVKQILDSKDHNYMSNIDEIFLLQVSEQRVSKVWWSTS